MTLFCRYLAIVAGTPLQDAGVPAVGVITKPVVHVEVGPRGQLGVGQHDTAVATQLSARTDYSSYSITSNINTGNNPAITLLFLAPHTGRKHQLRQHVLHLTGGKCGIVGDRRYANSASLGGALCAAMGLQGAAESVRTSPPRPSPIMLHACRIVIPSSTIASQTRDIEVVDLPLSNSKMGWNLLHDYPQALPLVEAVVYGTSVPR